MSLSNDATANVRHNESQRWSNENFVFQVFVNMFFFLAVYLSVLLLKKTTIFHPLVLNDPQ